MEFTAIELLSKLGESFLNGFIGFFVFVFVVFTVVQVTKYI